MAFPDEDTFQVIPHNLEGDRYLQDLLGDEFPVFDAIDAIESILIESALDFDLRDPTSSLVFQQLKLSNAHLSIQRDGLPNFSFRSGSPTGMNGSGTIPKRLIPTD